MRKSIKAIWKLCFFFILSICIGMFIANKIVVNAAKEFVFYDTDRIPFNKVGLLLGTSKVLKNGNINLYYRYRIDAAVCLFESKKIEYILVSGDNSSDHYDEPTTIKNDLLVRGVPESKIYLDYAGFRTLDSVVRCKEVFGQNKITVISQKFHTERAIYIAKNYDIDAVGYNAKDVDAYYGLKTKWREKLARIKVMLDMFFGVTPKYLGEKIQII